MFTCQLCHTDRPAHETLQDVMDPDDTGPVCVHCFSRLTRIATGRAHAASVLEAHRAQPKKTALPFGVVTL